MGIIRQIKLIDEETGEFISSNEQKLGTKLKEGWIVVYKKALVRLLDECPNFATLKVYLRIASAQTYDTITYITTPYIAKTLGMTYQTAWNAVKWLVRNKYIKKSQNKTGANGFIVNPFVSTCGKGNFDEKANAFYGDEEYVEVDEIISDETDHADHAHDDLPKARKITREKGKLDIIRFEGLEIHDGDYDEDATIPSISGDEFLAIVSGTSSIPASLL